MGKKAAIVGIAALAGLGYFVGKKIMAEKPDAEAVVKQSYNEKFHKASMFCVGAIKTGSEKIAEGISEIATGDMIKKGEDTIEKAKSTTVSFKEEIENLKDMVVSINEEDEEDDFTGSTDMEFSEVEETPDEGSESL